MSSDFLEIVYQHDVLADLDAGARRLALRRLAVDSSERDVAEAVRRAGDWIDAFGPLTPLMEDPEVTDILVNRPDDVWVERAGRLRRTEVRFAHAAEVRSLAERFVGASGGLLDFSSPMADARLPDGSRLHVVLPPVARDSPLISIRRFPREGLSLDELENRGMFASGSVDRLRSLVAARRSIVVTGATGVGKTTLLSALVRCVPDGERVVTIEETPEIRVARGHVVSLVARDGNVEGRGSIDLRTLVRAALRMRPDRIVVGEVRGAEALGALSAMSSGHPGSMLTLHARSADSALDRLVSLALEAGSSISEESLHRRVIGAVDAVVHLERRDDGRRVVAAILETCE